MDRLTFAAEHTIEGNTLSGVVHIFGTRSQSIKQGTLHRYEPGAFDRSIRQGRSIAFYSHDTAKPLGRPSLRVEGDRLVYSLELGQQTYANDLRENVAHGLMNQTSFGVMRGKSRIVRDADGAMVTVHTVADLVDISPVAFGDFEGTSTNLHAAGEEDRREQMARARFRVLEGSR